MDEEGHRMLKPEQFMKCLNYFEVNMTKEEINALVKQYDTSKNGTINYNEFLKGIRGELNPTRRAIVYRAFAQCDKKGRMIVHKADL